MAKEKTIYVCTSCGNTSLKWEGKCSVCQEWNTLVEQKQAIQTRQEIKSASWNSSAEQFGPAQPTRLDEIRIGQVFRTVTPDGELNRTLGGGIVPGSLILMGGAPGIGKSTLLLQTAMELDHKVLYVSGEESDEQIKMRANRLGQQQSGVFFLAETNIIQILRTAMEMQPGLLIIDSIQVMSSPYVDSTPGTITQVRECTGEIMRFSKQSNIPVFIIGHITKEGMLAGPKLLEHMVDVVLQFEGDRNYNYRILRTAKNRFGSTDELGIYEMIESGLKPVNNPSELLISQSTEKFSGSTVAATLEGQRPMLIETQSLVSQAVYGTPQRSATGYDLRRLNMLLAVLEKRNGLYFGQKDVFLNIAGGLKITDPAIDLAITVSLISSLQNQAMEKKVCFAGEIGLTGEVRAVKSIDQRIREADRLGFSKIFVSKYNLKGLPVQKYKTEIIGLGKIGDLFEYLFTEMA